MKLPFATLVVVGALAVVVAAASTTFAAQLTPKARSEAALLRLPPATPAGQTVLYGHIRALGRTGGRDVLHFDPAWWLQGAAAKNAAVADKAISPKQDVPNDYYVVEEGHRLLTFVVAASAKVTILTRGGSGMGTTTIALPELAQLLKGKNPKQRRVVAPLRGFGKAFGFWIRTRSKYPNAVRSLDQQYQP